MKELRANFKHKFEDLESFISTFAYFVNPFICDISDWGIESFEMKEDQALQMLHKASSMIELCKLVPELKYPNLKKAACRLFSIFGTTYCCESLYSTIKFVKSKHRSQLTNQHLTEFLRTVLTNFTLNFKNLTRLSLDTFYQ